MRGVIVCPNPTRAGDLIRSMTTVEGLVGEIIVTQGAEDLTQRLCRDATLSRRLSPEYCLILISFPDVKDSLAFVRSVNEIGISDKGYLGGILARTICMVEAADTFSKEQVKDAARRERDRGLLYPRRFDPSRELPSQVNDCVRSTGREGQRRWRENDPLRWSWRK